MPVNQVVESAPVRAGLEKIAPLLEYGVTTASRIPIGWNRLTVQQVRQLSTGLDRVLSPMLAGDAMTAVKRIMARYGVDMNALPKPQALAYAEAMEGCSGVMLPEVIRALQGMKIYGRFPIINDLIAAVQQVRVKYTLAKMQADILLDTLERREREEVERAARQVEKAALRESGALSGIVADLRDAPAPEFTPVKRQEPAIPPIPADDPTLANMRALRRRAS